MASLPKDLRGLVLSAPELKALTGWDDALVEDYLNIYRNLLTISDVINEKNNKLKGITTVTPDDSPYTMTSDDEDILFDTDLGDITAYLPKVVEVGQNYRLISVGNSDNKVYIYSEEDTDLICGDTEQYLIDKETLILTYDTTEGWN